MKIFRFTLLSVVLSCSCTLFYSCTEDSSLDEIGKPVPDNWGAQDPRYEELTETLTSLTHKTILNSGNFNPETGASYLKQIRKKRMARDTRKRIDNLLIIVQQHVAQYVGGILWQKLQS